MNKIHGKLNDPLSILSLLVLIMLIFILVLCLRSGLTIGVFISSAAVVLQLIGIYLEKEAHTKTAKNEENPQAKRDSTETMLRQEKWEYFALQSQINPHFLYNTLEAIRSDAIVAGNSAIAAMTEKLARYYRYSISSRNDTVTLQAELYNLDDYFYIQQYRFGNRFSLKTIIEDEFSLKSFIPKLTLQPIVENAIFHGLETKKGSGIVTIHIQATDHTIYITVSDDGIGMIPEQVRLINRRLARERIEDEPQRHGIALENVNQRLHLQFGPQYGLHVESIEKRGTDVKIVIPRTNADSFQKVKDQ